jgi:hypothetical protein
MAQAVNTHRPSKKHETLHKPNSETHVRAHLHLLHALFLLMLFLFLDLRSSRAAAFAPSSTLNLFIRTPDYHHISLIQTKP